MKARRTWLAALLLLGGPPWVHSEALKAAASQAPSAANQPKAAAAAPAGLAAERLERLDAFVRGLVEQEKIAGAVVLIARRGRIAHFQSYGYADREAKRAMGKDAIFRICSMSKPITSVAAMLLFEEGRFLLDDPVATFLPELAKPQVIVRAGDSYGLVPATKPITIRHLLTHTSGISYRFVGAPVLADLYKEAGVSDGLAETELDLAENVRRIAAQPLLHEPGARFSYGLNTDVLGRLVEVVSGMPFGAFLQQRVFEPLGMVDTGFTVPAGKRGRLATPYRTDRGTALGRVPDALQQDGHTVFSASYPYEGARRFESGGAGLVSTAADYARFAEMLLRKGELDGRRLLSRKTVELMTADHLGGVENDEPDGFGLGVSHARNPGVSGDVASEGTFAWSGFYTTRFWVDPEEQLVGVVMTQTYPYNSHRVLDRIRAMAYQAIAD
jgi:CubicO group peptidase (beta-lactamase class C family)